MEEGDRWVPDFAVEGRQLLDHEPKQDGAGRRRQLGVPVDVESTGQFLIIYSLCEKSWTSWDTD